MVTRAAILKHCSRQNCTVLELGADHGRALRALGISFGQDLIDQGPFEWMLVEDEEFGAEISVAVRDASVFCHPIGMIWKRIEEGEAADLKWLGDKAIEKLLALARDSQTR